MSDLGVLVDYLKRVKKELEEYKLDNILLKIKILNSNLDFLNENLSSVDIALLRELLLEKYNPSEVDEKLNLFNTIRKMEKYFDKMKDEPQIVICLNKIEDFKVIFKEKIDLLNLKISETVEKNTLLKDKLDKFLSYFDNDYNLIKSLTEEELENLIDFIIESNIKNKYEILNFLGISQIRLLKQEQELQLVTLSGEIIRNTARINRLNSQEEILPIEDIDTNQESEILTVVETSNIENITEEEQSIYSQILEIFESLNKEGLIRPDEDIMTLLEDDYKENSRSIIYENSQSDLNIWSLIYYDLKENLLPNFLKNKETIIKIFKFIINKYKKDFIKKEDFLSKLEVIKKIDTQSILKYMKLLNNLPENLKNNLKEYERSMLMILEKDGKEGLKNAGFDTSLEDIKFYLKIEDLIAIFDLYNEELEKKCKNDKVIASTIISNIEEYQEEIEIILQELALLDKSNKKIEDEESLEELNENQDVNLPIFFPFENQSIHDASIMVAEEMKKNYAENAKVFMKQNVEDIEEMLLRYPWLEIQIRAKKGRDKSLNQKMTNKNSRPKFSEYDVFRYKHELATSGRVVYMMLHISDNNKKRLQQYFKLKELGNICLILNLDAAVLRDHKYVSRSYQILIKNEEYIKEIIELFKNDFVNDEDFDRAIELINSSISELDLLKQVYSKKTDSIQIGGTNDNE